jgi:hypothetical protein
MQKGKRAKILPFAKSGKSFAIRGVWIQMAKVLAKSHLNLFSPSPIPFPATSFPPFHTECIKLTIQNLYSPNQSFLLLSVFAVSFCYLFLLFPFCYRVFGSKWKKKEQIFCYLPFCQRIQTGPKPWHDITRYNQCWPGTDPTPRTNHQAKHRAKAWEG